MKIIAATGIELEKEKPNTSEDFFNRSSVVYLDNGEEKEFHVLYVRYFDEQLHSFTPFEHDPIFTIGESQITIKDTVALVCLLKNKGYKEKKRIYINESMDFKRIYDNINFNVLEGIFQEIVEKGHFQVDANVGLTNT